MQLLLNLGLGLAAILLAAFLFMLILGLLADMAIALLPELLVLLLILAAFRRILRGLFR